MYELRRSSSRLGIVLAMLLVCLQLPMCVYLPCTNIWRLLLVGLVTFFSDIDKLTILQVCTHTRYFLLVVDLFTLQPPCRRLAIDRDRLLGSADRRRPICLGGQQCGAGIFLLAADEAKKKKKMRGRRKMPFSPVVTLVSRFRKAIRLCPVSLMRGCGAQV